MSDQHAKIDSLARLQAWLRSNNIDTSEWGKGEAKTIADLLTEITNGECVLQDNPPRRIVSVAQVLIRRGEYTLIEARQEFGDGRARLRNHPLSEKIKPGEHYQEAVRRGIQEELGVPPESISVLASSYRQTYEETPSPSYPGLRTLYIFDIVEARVEGLPEADFWTRESGNARSDRVSTHFWEWRRAVNRLS